MLGAISHTSEHAVLGLHGMLHGSIAGGPPVGCSVVMTVQGYPLVHADGLSALSLRHTRFLNLS